MVQTTAVSEGVGARPTTHVGGNVDAHTFWRSKLAAHFQTDVNEQPEEGVPQGPPFLLLLAGWLAQPIHNEHCPLLLTVHSGAEKTMGPPAASGMVPGTVCGVSVSLSLLRVPECPSVSSPYANPGSASLPGDPFVLGESGDPQPRAWQSKALSTLSRRRGTRA